MSGPLSKYLTILDREIHYVEWGDPSKPKLVMWHGLARTGRDFDDLAQALSQDWNIVAPDTIGRGLSQWSPKPEAEYCYDFYATLATAFVDALGWRTFDWVGTSMGGGIAIRAAAGPLSGRIGKLVLNDIGPEINPAAVERIRSYAGKPPRFERVSELEAYLRQIYIPYGWLSDAQWRRMTETSARRLPDGGITTHYDPNMVMQFVHHPDDNLQWAQWADIDCPMLCLRGEKSDLLLPDIAAKMPKENPRCRVVEVKGCGHAPALNVPEQIGLVRDFLFG
ncbi:MAG: alpha/beta hydrolase [Hyphomicrobiales bacterium]|nr:alpha/beta hydrolase [Hyphomicrobiales bacterium]